MKIKYSELILIHLIVSKPLEFVTWPETWSSSSLTLSFSSQTPKMQPVIKFYQFNLLNIREWPHFFILVILGPASIISYLYDYKSFLFVSSFLILFPFFLFSTKFICFSTTLFQDTFLPSSQGQVQSPKYNFKALHCLASVVLLSFMSCHFSHSKPRRFGYIAILLSFCTLPEEKWCSLDIGFLG